MLRNFPQLGERDAIQTLYYNMNVFPGVSLFLSHQSESRAAKGLLGLARWNGYVFNWPIVLKALRWLWEMGKSSELKSPFYEPVEQQANK